MWEAVEASAREIGVGKTEGRRSNGGKRGKERKERKKEKPEEGECYELKLKGLSDRTTLVLSNTRELDRVPKTK